MEKYIAYLIQKGEGCDYSIDCGKKIIKLDAIFYDEAIAELKQIIDEDYNYPETQLSTVSLYEVFNKLDIPIKKWYKEWEQEEEKNERKQAEENEENEENEKKEYLRLKAKFEHNKI